MVSEALNDHVSKRQLKLCVLPTHEMLTGLFFTGFACACSTLL